MSGMSHSFNLAGRRGLEMDEGSDPLTCDDISRAEDYDLSACQFAKVHCDGDPYTKHYYCFESGVEQGFFIAACVLWLGLLFLLLGSTADDYFSPALEMFSTKLGLPPRFAGVTLLALGNGAPDVSSTISAIKKGGDGYLLSLGALTGAGMFVGTVVAGSVMVEAQGVAARGALIRDVSMYGATCLTVLLVFLSRTVGQGDVNALLSCYFCFISVVLAADVYHRTVVLPRQRSRAAHLLPTNPLNTGGHATATIQQQQQQQAPTRPTTAGSFAAAGWSSLVAAGYGSAAGGSSSSSSSSASRESSSVELSSAIATVMEMRSGFGGDDDGLLSPSSPLSPSTSQSSKPLYSLAGAVGKKYDSKNGDIGSRGEEGTGGGVVVMTNDNDRGAFDPSYSSPPARHGGNCRGGRSGGGGGSGGGCGEDSRSAAGGYTPPSLTKPVRTAALSGLATSDGDSDGSDGNDNGHVNNLKYNGYVSEETASAAGGGGGGGAYGEGRESLSSLPPPSSGNGRMFGFGSPFSFRAASSPSSSSSSSRRGNSFFRSSSSSGSSSGSLSTSLLSSLATSLTPSSYPSFQRNRRGDGGNDGDERSAGFAAAQAAAATGAAAAAAAAGRGGGGGGGGPHHKRHKRHEAGADLLQGVTNSRVQYIIMHADDDDYDHEGAGGRGGGDDGDDDGDNGGSGGSGYVTLREDNPFSPALPLNQNHNSVVRTRGEPEGGVEGGVRGGGGFEVGEKEEEEEELGLWERVKSEVAGEWLSFLHDHTLFGKTLFVAEYPFTVARRLCVPLTAETVYCKPCLLSSVALCPLWVVGWYLGLANATVDFSTLFSSGSSGHSSSHSGGSGNSNVDDVVLTYGGGGGADGSLPGGSGLGVDDEDDDDGDGDDDGSGSSGSGLECPLLLLCLLGSCCLSFGLHFVCSDKKPPPLWVGAPLALVGFAIAATWIDTVASQLVGTLSFFGTLLGIPEPVLGLTVLAWGNSIGDYSTNMAMAKKGLSNMAMTACFAGPVFNMLVGVGVGFTLLLNSDDPQVTKRSGEKEFPVELSAGIIAGFAFIATNCACIVGFGLFNKNFVPKQYGYVSGCMYTLYLLVSFLLLFHAV